VLALYPDGVPTSPQPGRLYAWSELIVGGEATVSRLESSVAEQRFAALEFLVSSGDAAYIANLRLLASGPGPAEGAGLSSMPSTLYFEGSLPVVRSGDRVPLDEALFTWHAERDGQPATVRLIPQTIDGAADGFRVCWLIQYAAVNRLACSVHGAPYAVHVVDDDGAGRVVTLRSVDGRVPWVAAPPAGTPAPTPVAGPIRYAFGTSVEAAVLAAPFAPAPPRSVDLAADDGSGSSARLSWSAAQVPDAAAPYGATRMTIDSVVDAARPATLTYSWPVCPRFCTFADVSNLALTADGRTVPLPGTHRLVTRAIHPLDRVLLEASGDGALARLVLQSIDGGPAGHRVCWLMRSGSIDRLACSVREVPGSTGHLVDDDAGRVRTYR